MQSARTSGLPKTRAAHCGQCHSAMQGGGVLLSQGVGAQPEQYSGLQELQREVCTTTTIQ